MGGTLSVSNALRASELNPLTLNANVIFIEASQDTKDKAEFIKGLKEELRNRSIKLPLQ